MSIQSAARTAISGAAITLVATLVSIYIVSQFLRNSIGVIAPNLAADLGLSPAEIGLLSSIFFFTFAVVQIPLGMALDRFGPRICLVVGAAITVIGAVVFACAASPGVLIFGRWDWERRARSWHRSPSTPGGFRPIALPRSPACRSGSERWEHCWRRLRSPFRPRR